MEYPETYQPRGVYSSLSVLYKWVVGIFVILAVIDIIAVFSGYAQAGLLSRIQNGAIVTDQEAVANDTRQTIVAYTQTFLYIVSAVLFLVWLYRTSKNLPSLGAQNVRFSPGWAVGWFFIPIMNLLRPYQVVSEIERLSEPDNDPHIVGFRNNFNIVAWWWTFYLISNFIGQIVMRIALRGESLSDYLTSTYAYMVSDSIDVVGIIITVMMVRQITRFQEAKNRQLNSYGGAAEPAKEGYF